MFYEIIKYRSSASAGCCQFGLSDHAEDAIDDFYAVFGHAHVHAGESRSRGDAEGSVASHRPGSHH